MDQRCRTGTGKEKERLTAAKLFLLSFDHWLGSSGITFHSFLLSSRYRIQHNFSFKMNKEMIQVSWEEKKHKTVASELIFAHMWTLLPLHPSFSFMNFSLILFLYEFKVFRNYFILKSTTFLLAFSWNLMDIYLSCLLFLFFFQSQHSGSNIL